MDEETEYDEMANKEACCKAFVEWFEANKTVIEDLGAFSNARALAAMGFRAGWAAHKAADVWE